MLFEVSFRMPSESTFFLFFYDFGDNFMILLVPLGTLLASFLERIWVLLAVRVAGRLMGWIP